MRSVLFISLVMLASVVFGQDTLIAALGHKMIVHNVAIDKDRVHFLGFNGRPHSLKRVDVLKISFRDGTQVTVNPNTKVVGLAEYAKLVRNYKIYRDLAMVLTITGATATLPGTALLLIGASSTPEQKGPYSMLYVGTGLMAFAGACLVSGIVCIRMSQVARANVRQVQPPVALNPCLIKNDMAVINGKPLLPGIEVGVRF